MAAMNNGDLLSKASEKTVFIFTDRRRALPNLHGGSISMDVALLSVMVAAITQSDIMRLLVSAFD